MQLILQNTSANEFLAGCEYTVVDIDGDLIGTIAARGGAFRKFLAADPSLWQLRFWDWRPGCINHFAGLDDLPDAAGTPFDGWIEEQGGWAVVGSLPVPDEAVVSTDCQTMTISADGPVTEVGWVYHLKDSPEIVRTAAVPFPELERRIATAAARPACEQPGGPSDPAGRSTRSTRR